MRRKMYWGLAVFIVILFTAGVFLLTQRNIDMEPDVVYEPPSPEVIQKIKDDIAERNAEEGAKPPPPGASPNGHWHDGVWHNEPHAVDISKPESLPIRFGTRLPLLVETENPVLLKPIPLRTTNGDDIDIDWVSLSPAELSDTIAKLQQREISAPDGYHYTRNIEGLLILDESGYPIIHKDGEDSFSVAWKMAFKPTREQLSEYQQLARRYYQLEGDIPPSPELDQVKARMDYMERTYVGPLPISFGSSFSIPAESFSISDEMAREEYKAAMKRNSEINLQLKAEIFRQLGIEYLLELY